MFPELSFVNEKNAHDQKIQTAAWIERWLILAYLRNNISLQRDISYSKIRFTMPIFFRLENQKKVIDDIEKRLFVHCMNTNVQVEKKILPPQLMFKGAISLEDAQNLRQDPAKKLADMQPKKGLFIQHADSSQSSKQPTNFMPKRMYV
jgi:hypothetical protein